MNDADKRLAMVQIAMNAIRRSWYDTLLARSMSLTGNNDHVPRSTINAFAFVLAAAGLKGVEMLFRCLEARQELIALNR